MSAINWNNVIYTECDRKLICTEQSVCEIPDAIINLYHNRVRIFDLSYNQLTSLSGIELFLHLKELILDNNFLSDNIKLPRLKGLTALSLNNNKINNLNIFLLRLSNCFPNLEYLSMMGNKACPDHLSSSKHDCTYEQYRCYIISMLPKLKFLDSRKVSHSERENSTDFIQKSYGDIEESIIFRNPFEIFNRFRWKSNIPCNPLPSSSRAPGEHKGAYSRCKLRYCGTNSEGNRFISNNDL